jgi:UDP-N-acetylmuramoyl-L-alanyl-D-glutamate--2,6-diaminopimelate ligase
MEAYFAAKARLFDPSFTDLAVVCVDDPRGRLLLDAATVETVGYGIDDAEELHLRADGSTLRWRGVELQVPVAGRFNAVNAIGVATVASELDIDNLSIAMGIASAPPVRGRFEPVVVGQPFGVVVDYAHTPDGLEQVLRAAREVVEPGRRVLVVFGAGGDRDPAKRPRMGEAAATHADRVVVTSDNPRSEDPTAIIDAIVDGIADRSVLDVEPDRGAAIALAVDAAEPGDIVVIAGKGHETTQTTGDRIVPFDDVEVARGILRERGWKNS